MVIDINFVIIINCPKNHQNRPTGLINFIIANLTIGSISPEKYLAFFADFVDFKFNFIIVATKIVETTTVRYFNYKFVLITAFIEEISLKVYRLNLVITAAFIIIINFIEFIIGFIVNFIANSTNFMSSTSSIPDYPSYLIIIIIN